MRCSHHRVAITGIAPEISPPRRPSLPPPLRIKDLINLQLEEPDRIPYVCSSYLSVPPSLLLGCLVPGSLQPHAVAQVIMDTS